MGDQTKIKPLKPTCSVEHVSSLSQADLNDLCDATDEAITAGGGFGWIDLPAREILERYWQGVLAMPARMLFVARLDNVICGTAQLITPPKNNEAQSFAATMTTVFVAPWARGHGLAKRLIEEVEKKALEEKYSVINLDVRETQEAAISVYEKMGYIHFGTHPYYALVDNQIIKGRYYYKVIDKSAVKQTP
jgi:ribosomal protein S18 acetylase RimI-like enzyme